MITDSKKKLITVVVVLLLLLIIGGVLLYFYQNGTNPFKSTNIKTQESIKMQILENEQVNQKDDVTEITKIDLSYPFLKKGRTEGSIYLSGELFGVPTEDAIVFSDLTPDMYYRYYASCKITATTQFYLFTDGKASNTGEIIRNFTLNTNRKIDDKKMVLVELKYGTDQLYNSPNNICLTIEQIKK